MLIPLMEYMTHKTMFLKDMPNYTPEKKTALISVISLHNSELRRTLSDLEDVRSRLMLMNTLANVDTFEKIKKIKDTLTNLKDRSSEFVEELKKF